MDMLGRLVDTSGFPPRWHCGTGWTPALGWTHIVSDILIFLAYFAIPIGLAVVLFRRRDLPYPGLMALFVAFILSCGLGHLVEAIIFWTPVYRLSAVVKVVTAGMSVATAVVLIAALPGMLTLPGLREANTKLEETIRRERTLADELSAARDAVERRSAQLTLQTRRFHGALAASRAVACRWEVASGEINWEIGFAESAAAAGWERPPHLEGWGVILDADAWERLREEASRAIAEERGMEIELPLQERFGGKVRLAAAVEPASDGDPRATLGMFRLL